MKSFVLGAVAALALSTSAFAGEFQGEWNGTVQIRSNGGSYGHDCDLVAPITITQTATALEISGVDYLCKDTDAGLLFGWAFTIQEGSILWDGQPVGQIVHGNAEVVLPMDDGDKWTLTLALNSAGKLTYVVSIEIGNFSIIYEHQLRR
jgi:hypothetical protein